MTLRMGELFAGVGGLGLGVASALDVEHAWFSEWEPPTKDKPRPSQAPARILAHRFPGVPNHGDITAIDWTKVEPVDVLTGGSPCQDLSAAGKRVGMKAGTRSGLWASMLDAVRTLRPSLVIWENVRGAFSAEADSEVEPCPGCVGDGSAAPLRALGRVLGDLANVGYVGSWVGLRAADVGAPHGRFRAFVAAWPADAEGPRLEAWRDGQPAQRATSDTGSQRWDWRQGVQRGGWNATERVEASDHAGDSGRAHAAPDATRGGWHEGRPEPARLEQPGADAAPDTQGGCEQSQQTSHGGDRPLVSAEPRTGPRAGAGHPAARVPELGRGAGVEWGVYEPAIRRWEHILGRVAPPPTEVSDRYLAMVLRRQAGLDPRPVGMRGSLVPVRRLSPRFVEWMQGLDDGWVTDVPGVSRNDALKALGNIAVPQQAAEALRRLLAVDAGRWAA